MSGCALASWRDLAVREVVRRGSRADLRAALDRGDVTGRTWASKTGSDRCGGAPRLPRLAVRSYVSWRANFRHERAEDPATGCVE